MDIDNPNNNGDSTPEGMIYYFAYGSNMVYAKKGFEMIKAHGMSFSPLIFDLYPHIESKSLWAGWGNTT
jgi:hypothetical protein